jgi:hypothetical protein
MGTIGGEGVGTSFERPTDATAERENAFQGTNRVPLCSSTVNFAAVPIVARSESISEPA